MKTRKNINPPKKRIVFAILLLFLFFHSCHSKKQNHLANASSPYLKEHADNPVDWYEWGDEALQVAKKENKPLLISIGYSSCHWCHQMEKESFVDTTVARIMNENFVCIKVDREERPDIDDIFTNACQLLTGNSGWPLNAFALPDGKPFFAGTYFSKASWISLLKQIAEAYKNQNNKVILQAQTLANGIAHLEFSVIDSSIKSIVNENSYQNFFDSLYKEIDLVNGGFKGTPKFPSPSSIEFCLQYYYLTNDKRALDAATTTLTKMALGGIYDQVGGGFARYAIDSLWHFPHFEKMLYNNAQLMSVYAHAYQLTGNIFFKTIVEEIADFINNDLTDHNGGFYSSLNADTKEGEGEFYSWNYQDFRKDCGGLIASYFNVNPEGNWKENKNVLFASSIPEEFASKNKVNPGAFSSQLLASKKVLQSKRNKKERPAVDDKILTSWNALMLEGYLDAYASIKKDAYLQRALASAHFLEKNMLQQDGGLRRSYKDGKTSINAFLEDYALLAKAFIRLYQLTFEKHWLLVSKQLTDYTIKNFYDPTSGMFFYTSNHSTDSFIKRIDITDTEMPSSNSAMAKVLFDLNLYFENDDYLNKSSRMLLSLYNQIQNKPGYFANWGFLAGNYLYSISEVAIVGSDALKRNLELQENYLPQSIFLGSTNEENLPLLEDKKIPGKTLIYVCTNKTCKRPVEETIKALGQLKRHLKKI